jgi:hypothetical protein
MTQLEMFRGQRLALPVGVDWFRQLKPAKLLNLKPGTLVWYIDDAHIVCAEVTRSSERIDIIQKPAVHGIQVFCSSRTKSWSPYLARDKKPGMFHMITDREAAFEYYAGDHTDNDPPLRLVSTR